MNWNTFFFAVLPYVGLVLFFGLPLYRAFQGHIQWSARGDFFWTTRASGFFGRRMMGIAALFLHWGIFLLFFGHLLAFLGSYFRNEELVVFFRFAGPIGGVAFVIGILIALLRRIVNAEMRAMSTAEDYIVLLFLLVIPLLALYRAVHPLILTGTLFPQVYTMSAIMGPWLVSIFTFSPNAEIMAGLPLVTKLHIIIATIFFCYFPFTKLVHFWSYPFGYITRPFVVMRSYSRTMS